MAGIQGQLLRESLEVGVLCLSVYRQRKLVPHGFKPSANSLNVSLVQWFGQIISRARQLSPRRDGIVSLPRQLLVDGRWDVEIVERGGRRRAVTKYLSKIAPTSSISHI